MKKRLAFFSVCLFIVTLSCGCTATVPQATTAGVEQQAPAISVSENVPVPMRDGVNLMSQREQTLWWLCGRRTARVTPRAVRAEPLLRTDMFMLFRIVAADGHPKEDGIRA